jgi:hypothetical protein
MPSGIYQRIKYIGGYKMSEETKEKMSLAKRNMTEENKKNIGDGHRAEKNGIWKGDEVGYRALHNWVQKYKGKARKCSFCGKNGSGKQIQWANIDHQYRRVLEDYISLCSSCHKKYDIENNLKHKDYARQEG